MRRPLPRDVWILAAVLALFAVVAACRLNPFCLFEPDSPEYLFGSRSLAEMRGYLEIDHVGEPPHTFRPPGLPLLLVPLSWVRPFDVVAAKVVIIACSLLFLALVWGLARSVAGPWGAAAALVLVASSPYTLLHGTEVVSEVPFLAGSLGLMLLVARPRRGPPSWQEVGGGVALLAFLPLLRMVGLALAGALALWAVRRPERRRWLVAAASSVAVFLAWAWRCHAVGTPSYLGAIQNKLDHGGLAAGEQLRFYLGRFSQVLLPGLSPGQPVYERLLVEGAPTLPLRPLEILLGLACVALAVQGAWRRKEEGGTLTLLYAAFTFAILAVYPPRHERLVWPLIPMVWIFLPAGLPRKKGLELAALALAAALGGWQLLASVEIVRTNLQWRAEGERFYARVPPMYFADFEGAGRWIAAHAPPPARVLTRHSEVAFASGRFQEAIRFEESSPTDWRRALSRLRARYLVVPTTQLGRLFPEEALTGDPIYTFVPVHAAGDVQVLEVRPNRTGTVTADASDEVTLAACRAAVERFPERADLRVRLAELLGDAGRVEEALAVLAARGSRTAREELARGELLLRAERPEEARLAFQHASTLPEADLLERRIQRGLLRASHSGGETFGALLEQARFSLEVLRPGEALQAAERARALAPQHPGVLFAYGTVLQRLGRFEEAEQAFEGAQQGGHPDAAGKLRLLELRKQPPSLELARALAEDGTPGAALDVLERLEVGGDPEALHFMADLYLFYGDAARAAPLYRALGNGRGLAACEELQRLPSSLRPWSSPPPA